MWWPGAASRSSRAPPRPSPEQALRVRQSLCRLCLVAASARARNPLIYAGEGVIYAGASNELNALAELVNAPVITTLKAKGAFPENHPLFVGVRGDQVETVWRVEGRGKVR